MPFFGTTMGNGCQVSSMWHDNTHALVVALIYTCAKLNIKKDSELPETDHHNRKTLFSSVLYAHNASFPPLARSPPDLVGYRTVCPSPWRHSHWLYICTPTSCNWLCGRLSTTPVHGRSSMPFSWRSSIIMFCRNEAEDLDYSTLDCLCLYPAACATSPCRFFFSRSIKHPQAIVFVQFVRRPIMCSYEPWLHSFLNEGSKLLTSFCLPGFYTGK